ncbi:hypothetical protein Val02_53530 [Virgisporangium aliadipatigenens]|uniref:Pecanex-like protein 1 n=1 Tax=Virgisporangium aliadipatigenens TaxID=741659 RepID=A0A8J3YQ10_9ACTN|nr:hypothetical protein Val02_53530 [Virgisporangium aliadipatigenens]
MLAAVITFAAVVTVTQVSNASSRRWGNQNRGNQSTCKPSNPPAPSTSGRASASTAADGSQDGGVQNGRRVRNYADDGRAGGTRWTDNRGRPCTPSPGTGASTGASAGASSSAAPPLQILGDQCEGVSKLPIHDGFQAGNKCVATEMGEVGPRDTNPSLLITDSPRTVNVGQSFQIKVSTRNLVRDRFLGAAAGGYYKESGFLNAQGLTRGHFHTACRMLANTNAAPEAGADPAFFVATEDGGGGREPDVITITVTGMPSRGIAQCSAWAGDGSHRIPLMELARQTPAFDSVRIIVQ